MAEEAAPTESELLAIRRRKLDQLRADGIDPFPQSYAGVVPTGEIQARFADVEQGTDTEERVRVAGRLHSRRGQGKMAFLDLDDRSGRIQLQAKLDVLGEEKMERLLSLDLGDLIGVDGLVFRSRRGELSVRVEDYAVLAKSLRPPPEKHHGLQDVETRFRHRELDLMANPEVRDRFQVRAKVISTIRRYLDDNGFVEVETPVLQSIYGGALARPFTTHFNALDREFYLRIATELYLKRCIVGGLERVYELGKNFRNEGLSPRHNPEFTVLEWYEAYADYEDTARRCETVVHQAALASGYDGPFDFKPPWKRETFVESIASRTGIDITSYRTLESLQARIDQENLGVAPEKTWAKLVDELLGKHVEPTLQDPTFIIDYPLELSPFAKKHRTLGDQGIVERWEAYARGMEIANAFTELNDPDDQRERFEAQQRYQAAGDDETQPMDEAFLSALEHGMPPTGGIGIGIDRLVMILTDVQTIREVVLFPAMR